MYVGQPQSGQQMMPPLPPQPPMPVQPGVVSGGTVPQQNRNGPIYVPSNVSKVNQAAAAAAAAAVAAQQQQQQVMGALPNPPQNMYSGIPQPPPPQQQQITNNNGYGQANGGYGNPQQYGAQPMPPQVPPHVNSPPQAVPPPPDFGNSAPAPAPPQV